MFTQAFRRFTNALSPNKRLPIRLCSTAVEPQTAPAVASSGERQFWYLFSKSLILWREIENRNKNDNQKFISDIHNINVTGKVLNIYSFENGTMTFYIKSICPGGFRYVIESIRDWNLLIILKRVKSDLFMRFTSYFNFIPTT